MEEGKLILRRRGSVEKKYAAQLYSITWVVLLMMMMMMALMIMIAMFSIFHLCRPNVDNATLSSRLVPLAEENNKILEGIL